MHNLDDPSREQIITTALSARTLEQVECATHELNRWLVEHPDDHGIKWAFEQLALVELALLETAATPETATLVAKAS
jgi:hypothetical protein